MHTKRLLAASSMENGIQDLQSDIKKKKKRYISRVAGLAGAANQVELHLISVFFKSECGIFVAVRPVVFHLDAKHL